MKNRNEFHKLSPSQISSMTEKKDLRCLMMNKGPVRNVENQTDLLDWL